jgi:exosortase
MGNLKRITAKCTECFSDRNRPSATHIRIVTGILIFLAFLWSYWSSVFTDLWTIWLQSDEYSSGLLVPLIAGCIIWTRRKQIAQCKITPSLWGLVLFISAQAFRFFGLFFMYASAERISMLMTLSALVLLLFGWKMLAKLATVILFLFLMIPLPNSVHYYVTLPLQNWATTSAVYCLETFGFTVVREGNVIHLNGITVAVAEACNGLRMLTSFLVISSMVAMLVKRDFKQKIIVVASSIPIALMCNTIRLTATSIAFTYIDSARWEGAFHDFGGLAMMPVALGIIVLELWLLSTIFITGEIQPEQVIIESQRQK